MKESVITIILLSVIPALFFTFIEGAIISSVNKKGSQDEKKGRVLFFVLFAINEIFCLFWLLSRS